MSRLPLPGADDGNWGDILNDFLLQAHNADGTLKSAAISSSGAALDSAVVHNTGSEIIAGNKNFSASPIVPTPTLGSQAANKTYVDTATGAVVSKGDLVLNVRDYGALGDGTTDDTSAISAALDAMDLSGKWLYFPAGTYICGALTKSYAPRIVGAGASLTTIKHNGTGAYTWTFKGSLSSSTTALTANLLQGAYTVQVPTTGFAVDDLLLVGDNTQPQTTGSSTLGYQGQLAPVYSIGSGTQLNLLDPAYTTFQTTQSAFVGKVTPIKNCSVKGISFYNADPTNLSGFLSIQYGRNIDIDTAGEGAGGGGVYLVACYDFHVRHHATNYYDTAITGLGQFGYGVNVQGACANGEVEVFANKVRHAFTTGSAASSLYGEPINITVRGVAHATTCQAWDTHAQGAEITFANCSTYGSFSYAYGVRCKRVRIIGGNVANTRGGVWLFEKAADIEVRGLSMQKITTNASFDTSGAGGRGIYIDTTASGLLIDGCSLTDIALDGIEIRQATSSLEITNNRFRNMGLDSTSGHKNAILINATLNVCRIKDNLIMDPQTSRTTLNAFSFNNAPTDIIIDGNMIHSPIVLATGAISLVKFGQNYRTAKAGYHRTLTYSASMAIDAQLQETATIPLTGNLTVTALSNATDGQVVRLKFLQDTIGNRTITLPANVKLSGGSFATSGANKTDILTLFYDESATTWYEVGRSLNM